MARVARLALVVASGLGFAIAAPSESRAGIIPWVYDAIFGPVGSLRAGGAGYPMAAGYAPYSAGYSPNYASYAPYYASYSAAPVTAVSYGAAPACSSCNQASYYAPATDMGMSFVSPACSSCGPGGCSNGTCTNCTVNSAPSSSSFGSTGISGPVADPNNRSRDEEMRRLERKIEELEHRENQTQRFLRRQHTDFEPDPYTPSTYRGETEEEVQARRRRESFDSKSANPENFPAPIKGRGPAPGDAPIDSEERLKPPLNQDGKSEEEKKQGTIKVPESEPQVLRLENRVTTRAVAPRERMQIVTTQSKVSIAKSQSKAKATVKTSVTPASELVRK
jgi:hypothetical protein